MEILENSTYKCHKELCVKFSATSSTAHKCTFFSNFRLSFFFLQLKRSVMIIPNNIEAEKKTYENTSMVSQHAFYSFM